MKRLTRDQLPPARDLADRLVAGRSLEDVAAEVGASVSTVRRIVVDAGIDVARERQQAGTTPQSSNQKVMRWWEPQPWAEEALCAQVDPEVFFPDKNEHGGVAKALCMTCPVRLQCLECAIEHNEWGIWGGTSDRQRREIRRQRAKDGAA